MTPLSEAQRLLVDAAMVTPSEDDEPTKPRDLIEAAVRLVDPVNAALTLLAATAATARILPDSEARDRLLAGIDSACRGYLLARAQKQS